jgi:putative transposase
VRFGFIRGHREEFRVLTMCRVLRVSRSGFYAWLRRPESRRTREDRRLLVEIRAIHQGTRGSYGSPRIHRELREQGEDCGRGRVVRLMKANGVVARGKRKFRATTDSKHSHPVAENVLQRCFAVDEPNRVWVGDITYLWTKEGWLYLSVLLDLFSRRVVGWSVRERLDAELVLEPLRRAIALRQPDPGLLLHHDQGSQYASDAYRGELERHGLDLSMSRKGDCWDNAVSESFFASFKTEWVPDEGYVSRAQARRDVFRYIEAFYNRERRHSTLGLVSPAQFERLASTGQETKYPLALHRGVGIERGGVQSHPSRGKSILGDSAKPDSEGSVTFSTTTASAAFWPEVTTWSQIPGEA